MQRDVTGANTALSFIDVLASALGAAVLLFVILASTPVSVPGKAQAAGTFIRYEWTVIGDPGALLRISIKPPSNDTAFIDLANFSGETVRKCELPGVSSYLLMGFARDAAGAGPSQDRTYVLRLNQPTPGEWEVGVLYYDRAADISSPPQTIQVRTVISNDANQTFSPSDFRKINIQGNALPVGAGPVETLKFGDRLLAPVIDEHGKKGIKIAC
jgi:hypothetical protein